VGPPPGQDWAPATTTNTDERQQIGRNLQAKSSRLSPS
jgi:hypothetical protein